MKKVINTNMFIGNACMINCRENPNKGKSYEEIMGVEKALEFKKRQSEMRKGRVVSEETKKKISDYYKNKKNGKDGTIDS